jgi:RND family efflux transporter MFP subunit
MNLAPLHRSANVALLAAVSLAAFGCNKKHPEVVATPPPVVLVSQPVERKVSDYQIFTARTKAVQSVDVKARVTGYLTEIQFQDGDDVTSGKVLFKIDDRPYKATLDEAQANVEVAKAALVKAQADYDIGINVRKKSSAAISEQDIDKRLGARDEAAARVKEAEAALENAQLNYGWCTVTTPISGRINRHFVDVGNLVSQDVTTLTNIVSIKPMWAYFNVDQNTVLEVQKLVAEGKANGARDATVEANMSLGDDPGFPIAGKIDFVSNQLDPSTSSLLVRAAFPNDDGSIADGLFGRIRVPIGSPHNALLVIDRAVSTNQGQNFVLVVNDRNEVEYRAVDVGQLHDGLREVLRYFTVTSAGSDGKDVASKVEVLRPTDWLVVEGLMRARPGDKVEPKHVDMQTLLPADRNPQQAAPTSAPK